MGKTRDLFKKIRDIKGIFYAKMGTIKYRNGMDLIGAIKKMWQEYTEEQYKKDFNDPDNHDGVITYVQPDILASKVKWALGRSLRTKLVKVIEFQLSNFLKDDAVKILHSICQLIWKTQQWPQDWKKSIYIPIPKKSNAKECSN